MHTIYLKKTGELVEIVPGLVEGAKGLNVLGPNLAMLFKKELAGEDPAERGHANHPVQLTIFTSFNFLTHPLFMILK